MKKNCKNSQSPVLSQQHAWYKTVFMKSAFFLDMKRRNKFLTFFILLFVAVYLCLPSMETLVKNAVHKYGSEIIGTDVSLDGFDLKLTTGQGSVRGVKIGNPTGYKSKNIFYLGELAIQVDVSTLMKDTIVIDSVVINHPEITYEMKTLTENNMTDILHNIEKTKASDPEKAVVDKTETAKSANSSKKFIIRKLVVTNGKINAMVGVEDMKAPLAVVLPNIEMKNIGEEKQGAGIAETLTRIVKEILQTAVRTVSSVHLDELRNTSAKGLQKLQENAGENLDKLKMQGKDVTKNMTSNLKGLFK